MGLLSVTIADNVEERIAELKKFGVLKFFQEVELVPRSQGEKDFKSILQKLGVEPSNTIVVGDNLKKEISQGNKTGAFTVWTKERFLGNPKPENIKQILKATIDHIIELIPLVEQRY